MEPSLEQFSAALLALYAAPLDPKLWPSALTMVGRLADCAVEVNVVHKHPQQSVQVLLGERMAAKCDDALIGHWADNFAMRCPRMVAGAARPDAPFLVDGILLSESEMDRDPVYDFYTRHDVRYFVGSALIDRADLHINWALQRSNHQGHAERKDIDLFVVIGAHVQRAFELAVQIGSLSPERPAALPVLDCVPQALFALDSRGRIIAANRRGERLLSRRAGISGGGGLIAASAADEDRRLQRLIAAAACGEGGWMRVSRPNGGAAVLVSVLPLRCQGGYPPAPGACVLVFVHDPLESSPAPPDMLVNLFGLTAAEARLASALSLGHTVESAAHLLGLSVETVRSYLKSIFHKVGVSRQADLTRLLASLPSVETTALS